MINDKKEKLYINIVLALLVLGIVCCFTLYPILCDTVSAESLTSNSVLDFNQLLNVSRNFSIKSTTSDRTNHYAGSLVDFDPTHKYYFGNSSTLSTVFLTIVRYNAGSYVSYTDFSTDSIYYNNGNYNQVVFQINTEGVVNGTFNFMVVDLTQCFGAGNEPTTVEEFKSYFVNDFYNYTLSTLVPLDSSTSYSQGYVDGMQSFSIVTAGDDIYGSSYYLKGYNDSPYFTQSIPPYFYALVPAQEDTLVFPMTNTIPANSNFNLSGFISSYIHSYTGTLNIYALSKNNEKILLGTVSFNDNIFASFSININVPFSVSNIAFDSSAACVIGDVIATYKISNLDKLAQDNFIKGKESVDVESLKYQAYNKGKSDGIASANKYTFSALFSSVIDAPIKAITGLLDFDIFGVNLKSFMLSLFTIALIIAIVRIFLGGSYAE